MKLKEPKTKAGKRVVSLDPVAALRSRLRKALEEGFDPAQVPIVFANIRGDICGARTSTETSGIQFVTVSESLIPSFSMIFVIRKPV